MATKKQTMASEYKLSCKRTGEVVEASTIRTSADAVETFILMILIFMSHSLLYYLIELIKSSGGQKFHKVEYVTL